MNTDTEFLDRNKIRHIIDRCKDQLAPSPNRMALVLEHLGIQKLYFASANKHVRVDIADKRAFMLARIRYGF
jgi:hypothetical protein